MSEPFIGEIRIFAINFAPRGWAQCNGQILPINQNQALFSLLGTTYGGDGRTTFALPDLRGRVPVHMGAGITLGESAGEEVHRLAMAEMPIHTHQVRGGAALSGRYGPTDALWGEQAALPYGMAPDTVMAAESISQTGSGQPHLNLQPYLVLNFCIALQGIFPSRE